MRHGCAGAARGSQELNFCPVRSLLGPAGPRKDCRGRASVRSARAILSRTAVLQSRGIATSRLLPHHVANRLFRAALRWFRDAVHWAVLGNSKASALPGREFACDAPSRRGSDGGRAAAPGGPLGGASNEGFTFVRAGARLPRSPTRAAWWLASRSRRRASSRAVRCSRAF